MTEKRICEESSENHGLFIHVRSVVVVVTPSSVEGGGSED